MIDEKHLEELADIFQKETMHYSFVKTDHFAFQELISYGKEIIPFFLNNIEKYNWLAFAAIRRVIDSNECPKIDNETEAGRLKILIEIYKKWGKEKYYLP